MRKQLAPEKCVFPFSRLVFFINVGNPILATVLCLAIFFEYICWALSGFRWKMNISFQETMA